MNIEYDKIQEQLLGTFRFDLVRLTRDEHILLGGVIVPETEWLNSNELRLTVDEQLIPPEIFTAHPISDVQEVKIGEIVVLDAKLSVDTPFRVKNIEEIEPLKHCITLQKTTGEEVYLYTDSQSKDTFTLRTQKQKHLKSGFTVQLKQAPTLYSVVQVGGKQALTEFQLTYESKKDQSI